MEDFRKVISRKVFNEKIYNSYSKKYTTGKKINNFAAVRKKVINAAPGRIYTF